jgi:hypothetical protein
MAAYSGRGGGTHRPLGSAAHAIDEIGLENYLAQQLNQDQEK